MNCIQIWHTNSASYITAIGTPGQIHEHISRCQLKYGVNIDTYICFRSMTSNMFLSYNINFSTWILKNGLITVNYDAILYVCGPVV